jgi:hypothetical protein
MLRLLRSRNGQNTAEYAILIALVIGVFSAMQIYVRRGLNARVKGGTDKLPQAVMGQAQTAGDIFDNTFLGDPSAADYTQYEPYYITKGQYSMTSTTQEGTEEGINDEAGGQRQLIDQTSQRIGSQTITGSAQAD